MRPCFILYASLIALPAIWQQPTWAAEPLPVGVTPVPAVPSAPVSAPSPVTDNFQPGLAETRNQTIPGLPVVAFTDAVALVLKNSPRLAIQQANARAAAARVGTARSTGGLQVGANGSAQYQDFFGPTQNSFGGGGGGAGGGGAGLFTTNHFTQSGTINSQYPLYSGGRVKGSVKAAEALARSQVDTLMQTQQDLVLETAIDYLTILRNDQLFGVAVANQDVSRERLRVARVRFEAGASARLDVMRAQTDLATADLQRINAASQLAVSRANLNTLMGRQPETPLRIVSIEALEPIAVPANVPNPELLQATSFQPGDLRTLADRNRPLLAGSQEQITAAEAGVTVARSGSKPNINLSLAGLVNNPPTFLGRFTLSLAASIAQTLFDSGRTRSQVQEAQAQLDSARQGLSDRRLAVANQIEQMLLTVDGADRRLHTVDSAVATATEALRAAQLGYQAGVRTALEVSDAQAALLAAQTEAVNSRFELAGARAQLAAAAGVLSPEWATAYAAMLREQLIQLGQTRK